MKKYNKKYFHCKNSGLAIYLISIILLLVSALSCCSKNPDENENKQKGLKDHYADNFLIGAALFPELFDDPVSADLIKTHFSAMTPENQMKWAWLHPTPSEYKFKDADKIAEFAAANNIKLIGHTLVWHSQLGRGVFTKEGSDDPNDLIDSETLLSRIKDHIFTVAGRYRDIFKIFNKHKDKISRVTFWGLHDGISWKNNFPIYGRTDYPLIFDRKMKPKMAYFGLIDLVDNKE